MTHKFRRWCAGLLAVLVVFTMASCDVPEDPTGVTDPSDPAVTDPSDVITPDPTDKIATTPDGGPSMPGMITNEPNIEVEQIRLSGYQENWIARFSDVLGSHAVVDSEQALEDVLDQIRSLNKTFEVKNTYDAAFFQQYYLVVIPAQSTSGSLRYELEATVDDAGIKIAVSSVLNGVGTADMADWLLFAVMPRAEYSVDAEITIQAGQIKQPEQGLDIYDQ